jgi:hypothetical protein
MDRELRHRCWWWASWWCCSTGRALIGALYDDQEMVRQANSLRAKLRSGGEAEGRPKREDLAALTALRDELAAKRDALAPAVRYVQPPEFSVAAGGSPDVEYVEILRREQQKLVKDAAYKGRSVPSNLGMPDLNPTGLEDVLRTLRSLHIVHVVVSAALEAGVDSVDEIRIPGAVRRGQESTGYLRLPPGPRRRHAARGAQHAGEASPRPALAGARRREDRAPTRRRARACRFGRRRHGGRQPAGGRGEAMKSPPKEPLLFVAVSRGAGSRGARARAALHGRARPSPKMLAALEAAAAAGSALGALTDAPPRAREESSSRRRDPAAAARIPLASKAPLPHLRCATPAVAALQAALAGTAPARGAGARRRPTARPCRPRRQDVPPRRRGLKPPAPHSKPAGTAKPGARPPSSPRPPRRRHQLEARDRVGRAAARVAPHPQRRTPSSARLPGEDLASAGPPVTAGVGAPSAIARAPRCRSSGSRARWRTTTRAAAPSARPAGAVVRRALALEMLDRSAQERPRWPSRLRSPRLQASLVRWTRPCCAHACARRVSTCRSELEIYDLADKAGVSSRRCWRAARAWHSAWGCARRAWALGAGRPRRPPDGRDAFVARRCCSTKAATPGAGRAAPGRVAALRGAARGSQKRAAAAGGRDRWCYEARPGRARC